MLIIHRYFVSNFQLTDYLPHKFNQFFLLPLSTFWFISGLFGSTNLKERWGELLISHSLFIMRYSFYAPLRLPWQRYSCKKKASSKFRHIFCRCKLWSSTQKSRCIYPNNTCALFYPLLSSLVFIPYTISNELICRRGCTVLNGKYNPSSLPIIVHVDSREQDFRLR